MSASSSTPQAVRRFMLQPSAGVLVLLVALCLFMATRSPSFMSVGNWSNIANQMVFVLLLTIGMTVVLITVFPAIVTWLPDVLLSHN